VLATLSVAGVSHHQHTLSQIIDDCLSESQRGRLDELLEKNRGHRCRRRLALPPYAAEEALPVTQPSRIKANLADLDALQTRYLELKRWWNA